MTNPLFPTWLPWHAAIARVCREADQLGGEIEPHLIEALRDGAIRSRRDDTGAELQPEFWSEGLKRWNLLVRSKEPEPGPYVEIHRGNLLFWINGGVEETAKKRGPRPTYEWEDFWAEIVSLSHHPDGLARFQTKAALANHMEQWFEDQVGKAPARSMIEERLARLPRELFPDN